MISFYFKILGNFGHLHLQDGFWFMLIPSGSMVKLQFLAQFSVDYFSKPVMSIFVILLRLYVLRVFLRQHFLLFFHWGLSDSKSHQVSRTLLSILVDFNNTLVWMVFIRPPISKFSRPFSKSLGNVESMSITTSITFMFHSFLNSRATSKYLSLFSLSSIFTLWSTWTAKSTH